MIKSEVRSLLILKPVIAPSLIRDCPLTIVSLEEANLSSQTDINLTSHHGDITQSGDIKAAQNIDINANQTYHYLCHDLCH
jgi:hypothetical protein